MKLAKLYFQKGEKMRKELLGDTMQLGGLLKST